MPSTQIYLLKHKLFSNVVKFSITDQTQHEFIAHLANNQNPLAQFTFVAKIECNDPSSVFEKVQLALKSHITIGELYEVSPQKALNIAQRETHRIPTVQND